MEKNCGTCKFWSEFKHYENIPSEGLCSEITEKVYIDFQGDGFVNAIETEEDFCCSLHQVNA